MKKSYLFALVFCFLPLVSSVCYSGDYQGSAETEICTHEQGIPDFPIYDLGDFIHVDYLTCEKKYVYLNEGIDAPDCDSGGCHGFTAELFTDSIDFPLPADLDTVQFVCYSSEFHNESYAWSASFIYYHNFIFSPGTCEADDFNVHTCAFYDPDVDPYLFHQCNPSTDQWVPVNSAFYEEHNLSVCQCQGGYNGVSGVFVEIPDDQWPTNPTCLPPQSNQGFNIISGFSFSSIFSYFWNLILDFISGFQPGSLYEQNTDPAYVGFSSVGGFE